MRRLIRIEAVQYLEHENEERDARKSDVEPKPKNVAWISIIGSVAGR